MIGLGSGNMGSGAGGPGAGTRVPRSLTLGSGEGGSWRDILRVLGYLRPYWHLIAISYACWLVSISMDMAIPRQIQWAIDDGIAAGNPDVLTRALLIATGLFLTKATIGYGYYSLFHVYEARAARDIRKEVYTALQRMSFAYLDRADTGQLIARATSDVDAVQRFMGHGTTGFVVAAGTYIITLGVMVFWNWQLTLLAIVTLPLMIWAGLSFGNVAGPLYGRVQQQYGTVTGVMAENATGVRVVKAFAQEPREIAKFQQCIEELFQRAIRLARAMALRQPLLMAIAGLGAILVVWWGGRLVLDGTVTIGLLIGFQFLLNRLIGPSRRFGWIINMVAGAGASSRRIFEVLDRIPEVKDREDARELEEIEGEVRLEHVWFEFEPGMPVLQDVNLTAKPGEVVALVGETGAGKSALTGLIPRFYDATRGRVLIDGQDVRDLTIRSLRRHMTIAPQEPFLFSESVRSNIAYGRPDSELTEVEGAATRAEAHHFASGLSDGYETQVGDRGAMLSGGQRQRVSLARAILVEPRILILDDATSSVDMETEYRIEQALQDVMSRKTTFVIAHRLSTVKRADQVLVMEQGKIVQRGKHEELIQKDGPYQRIYEAQMRDQEEYSAARQQSEASNGTPPDGVSSNGDPAHGDGVRKEQG